ncbi:protein kinase [Babesia caballi]|uniref:non-specific serine/threonine protein kinase n=1 Tax=Babesia caballi TaxID=5871 RepID=A0AAV4LRZ9_BABCB|nr:protein kinase [Babesia caballi]
MLALSQRSREGKMSDVEDSDSDLTSEASDSEEAEFGLRQESQRPEGLRPSNLFFAERGGEDRDALRSYQIYKRNHYEKGLTKDKRTTVQQVLDKRTYVRLRKLCGQGVFHYMHGVISTGKEANVFEAETQLPMPDPRRQCDEEAAGEGAIGSGAVDSESPNARELEASVTGRLDGVADDAPHSTEEVAGKLAGFSVRPPPESTNRDESQSAGGAYVRGRVAIKVYKTSILVFKDRSRYIEGEFRFRRAYVGTKNPRKMVAQWAEKEFRNLRRIALSGVYSPAPIALRDHILVMDLILNGGNVAPKLENLGALPLIEWQTIYVQTICIMRTLFQECKLIHGDFSSFNLLYSQGRVYVIDTSQALENDHLNAMPFLRRDCENVTRFFNDVDVLQPSQQEQTVPCGGLKLLTAEQLFCFIVVRSLDPIESGLEEGSLQGPPGAHLELWQDDALTDVKRFWETDESEVANEVAVCVEKMTRFNKFGTGKNMSELIARKRRGYLCLCRAVYDFLTGPLFADSGCWSGIAWLRSVNFDKQLPMNISQMSLDLAESAMEHTENVVIAINAISEDSSSDKEEREFGDSENEAEGVGGAGSPRAQAEACSRTATGEQPKFTGKIPDGVDPREWKRLVKEYNRERRKHKIPKHIKKKYGASKA